MALSVTFSKLLLRSGKVLYPASYAHMSGGEWGKGAGKGGGSGGSIRDAGGIFGKLEAAREEEYFRKLQSRQLAKLKKHKSEEISHCKRLIQMHKDSIARLEMRIKEVKSLEVDPESKTQ